jgi:hypothetical protein
MIAGLSSWLATMKTPFLLHANNLTSSELIGIATKTENNPVFAGQNSSRRTRAMHYSGPTLNFQHGRVLCSTNLLQGVSSNQDLTRRSKIKSKIKEQEGRGDIGNW